MEAETEEEKHDEDKEASSEDESTPDREDGDSSMDTADLSGAKAEVSFEEARLLVVMEEAKNKQSAELVKSVESTDSTNAAASPTEEVKAQDCIDISQNAPSEEAKPVSDEHEDNDEGAQTEEVEKEKEDPLKKEDETVNIEKHMIEESEKVKKAATEVDTTLHVQDQGSTDANNQEEKEESENQQNVEAIPLVELEQSEGDHQKDIEGCVNEAVANASPPQVDASSETSSEQSEKKDLPKEEVESDEKENVEEEKDQETEKDISCNVQQNQIDENPSPEAKEQNIIYSNNNVHKCDSNDSNEQNESLEKASFENAQTEVKEQDDSSPQKHDVETPDEHSITTHCPSNKDIGPETDEHSITAHCPSNKEIGPETEIIADCEISDIACDQHAVDVKTEQEMSPDTDQLEECGLACDIVDSQAGEAMSEIPHNEESIVLETGQIIEAVEKTLRQIKKKSKAASRDVIIEALGEQLQQFPIPEEIREEIREIIQEKVSEGVANQEVAQITSSAPNLGFTMSSVDNMSFSDDEKCTHLENVTDEIEVSVAFENGSPTSETTPSDQLDDEPDGGIDVLDLDKEYEDYILQLQTEANKSKASEIEESYWCRSTCQTDAYEVEGPSMLYPSGMWCDSAAGSDGWNPNTQQVSITSIYLSHLIIGKANM